MPNNSEVFTNMSTITNINSSNQPDFATVSMPEYMMSIDNIDVSFDRPVDQRLVIIESLNVSYRLSRIIDLISAHTLEHADNIDQAIEELTEYRASLK